MEREVEEDAVGDDRVGEPPEGESVARPQRGAGGRCRRSLEVRVSDGPPEEGPGLALDPEGGMRSEAGTQPRIRGPVIKS